MRHAQLYGRLPSPRDVWQLLERSRDWIPLSEKMYFFLIDAQRRVTPADPELCENVLQACLDRYHEDGISACRPTVDLYHAVMLAWNSARKGDDRVGELWEQLQEQGLRPNRRTYSLYLHALSLQGKAQQAQELLQQQYMEYKMGNMNLKLSLDAFTNVLAAWAKQNDAEAAGAQADHILNEMLRLRSQRELFINKAHDLSGAFNAAMQCHANRKSRAGAERAQEWYEQLKKMQHGPDTLTYQTLLYALESIGAGEEAERVLKDCLQAYQDGFASARPTPKLFSQVILAWSRSNDDDRVARARRILHKLEALRYDPSFTELTVSPDTEVALRPNVVVFNALLECIAHTKVNFPGQQCEDILIQMYELADKGEDFVRPNAFTYERVMLAWSRRGNTKGTLQLWKRMMERHQKDTLGFQPTLKIANIALASFMRSTSPSAYVDALAFFEELNALIAAGVLDFSLDRYSYITLMTCFARAKNQKQSLPVKIERAEQAERLFRKLQEKARSDRSMFEPNRLAYNIVMNGWGIARKPRRAQAIFEEMLAEYRSGNKLAKPDISTFNTLMKAWTFSTDSEALAEVEKILERIKQVRESGELQLQANIVTYTTAILSYGRHEGSPERADSLFKQMIKLSRKGIISGKPTRQTYNTLMKTWMYSNHPDRATRVKEIENEIERQFGK